MFRNVVPYVRRESAAVSFRLAVSFRVIRGFLCMMYSEDSKCMFGTTPLESFIIIRQSLIRFSVHVHAEVKEHIGPASEFTPF